MTTTSDSLREDVRRKYAEAAQAVTEGSSCGCGSGACCEGETASTDFGESLYTLEQRGELPDAAALASLGCGNPTAVAELKEGETVLDLGSGGGIDVILSAKRVGPTGLAYGLDMTDEMLALARKNAADAGITNAIFLKGLIEQIPLPADSVDVVISNCVINLSTEKAAVLAGDRPRARSRVAGSESPTSSPRTASRRRSAPSAAPTSAASRARSRRVSTRPGSRPSASSRSRSSSRTRSPTASTVRS